MTSALRGWPEARRTMAPPRVEHEDGRRAGDVQLTGKVEVLLDIEIHMFDAGHHLRDLIEDAAGCSAGGAERRRELDQGRLLPETVTDLRGGQARRVSARTRSHPTVSSTPPDTENAQQDRDGGQDHDSRHVGLNTSRYHDIPHRPRTLEPVIISVGMPEVQFRFSTILPPLPERYQ